VNNKIFSSGDYYDLFYDDKNYQLEANYIHEKIQEYKSNSKSILELGCGTGKHAINLTKFGYEILGIEKSESMLKKTTNRKNLEFQQGDIREIKLKDKFDCVISLFHVMSYQITNKSLISVFKTAFNHLKEEGLFLFDFWFGPAVIHQKPMVRTKTISTKNNTIFRIASPELLLDRNQVNVKYTYHDFDHGTKNFRIINELHQMRYFSIPELEFIANETGFKVLNFEEFLTGLEPSFDTWGVSIILRKNG
tara:strand:+ start:2571 stop:3320 length:750 start_codon:yes stop_codon:yes gene_type:complete